MSLASHVTSVDPGVQTISLPDACTQGLEDHQVTSMQQCVFNIRKGTGLYLAAAANNLYELRNSIKGNKKGSPRQWSQFKKAELVPFKAREITDLVSAWEGWMSTTSVDPSCFNLVGIRTCAKIAAASNATKAKVEARLRLGERVTEREVDEYEGNIQARKIIPKEWASREKEYKEKYKDYSSIKLQEECIKLQKRIFEMKLELPGQKLKPPTKNQNRNKEK